MSKLQQKHSIYKRRGLIPSYVLWGLSSMKENYVLKSSCGFVEIKHRIPDQDAIIVRELLDLSRESMEKSIYKLESITTKLEVNNVVFEIVYWPQGFVVYRYSKTIAGRMFKTVIEEERKNKRDLTPKEWRGRYTISFPENNNVRVLAFGEDGNTSTLLVPYSDATLKKYNKRAFIHPVK